jgi:chromosome segregation ATPase
MKAPELNELISESYPKKDENLIEQLKNKIYQLEQENKLYKQKNYNLEEEIKNYKANEIEFKSKLSLFMTQINNLRVENDNLNKSFQEMKIINTKLCEDNKTLMSELEQKINGNTLNKNIDNKNRNDLEEKDMIINKLNSDLNNQEEYIKKLFEDNKKLNDILKEGDDKINELNGNISILNKEINIRDDKIEKLEEEIYKINAMLEEANKENLNLNNLNLALKEKNEELFENLNIIKNNFLNLEQKNNSILLELDKKEKIINDFQEQNKIQAKQINNLMNKNNSLINNSKDSSLLMNKIKAKHLDLYNKYGNVQMRLEEIKNIFRADNPLEQILFELKENINYEENNNESINNYDEPNNISENDINNSSQINRNNKHKDYNNFRDYIYDKKDNNEMTMDKKYDFLFENNM